MKRIIFLLFILICAQISKGRELTIEEQKSAWDFIYSNMLPYDYKSYIYREDIIINLKGQITREDSIALEELLPKIQEAIPHLKIQLSDKKGNLILSFNDRTNHSVTSNITTTTIHHTERSFPSIPQSAEREKYIYYHLFRALIFKQKKEKDNELKGCVFSEEEYNSISYSPFDLFIIKKLYSPDFQIQLANNLPSSIQQTAWNSIRSKFLGGESKELILFPNEIAIKLSGNYSTADSLCMAEIINHLQKILPKKSIFLTSTVSNLDFVFNELGVKWSEHSEKEYSSIKKREIKLTTPQKSIPDQYEQRKKIIHYHLYRALVSFSLSSKESTYISGSVFDENIPENSKFHPIDDYIVKQLYTTDFHNNFKTQFIAQNQGSKLPYYEFMYGNQIKNIANYLGVIFALLFSLIFFKVFGNHKYKLRKFLFQGFIIVLAYKVYMSAAGILSNLDFSKDNLLKVLIYDLPKHLVMGLLIVLIIYFVEYAFLRKSNKGLLKSLVIPFLTTSLIPPLITNAFPLFFFVGNIPNDNKIIVYINTTVFWMIFAFVRTTIIYLRINSENLIRKKDLELARLSELNKQAELQSLQSKINPHFLYNSLNSIAGLARTDARKTEQMALALSDFFKYSLNKEQKEIVSLTEEIHSVETYLEIEKVRFGERLQYTLNCADELKQTMIPQFLIQPLIENAVKHGLSKVTGIGELRLEISEKDKKLEIAVYDNGPNFPNEPVSGYGLQSIQEKLKLIYGETAYLSWQNNPEKKITIQFPLQQKKKA